MIPRLSIDTQPRSFAQAALIAVLTASCVQDRAPPSGPDQTVTAMDPLQVASDLGPVRGHLDGGTTAFLGIPYAAAPVGALRWRAPLPHAPWTTPLDAAAFGPACAQPDGGLGQTGPTSEDCLTLNVWSPALGDAARAPVMVFIHGGAFVHGSANQDTYQGRRLARAGVVVVTMNYRLGVFGFLAHPALSAEDPHHSSGNTGLLDQQAALDWVQRNIAAFGGDPDQVTIFGESAGAMSVCAHVVSPLAAGRFRRAISESGPCSFLATPLTAPAGTGLPSAESLGLSFAAALGCAAAPDVLACMRGKPADELIAAAPTGQAGSLLALAPNIDGYVLPEPAMQAIAAGHHNAVDQFLAGVNQDEATLFTASKTIETAAEYAAAVAEIVPSHAADALALYPAASYPTPKDAYNALVTDLLFACPTRAQIASLARRGTPSYEYLFTRLTRFGQLTGLGVHHGAELPFVFGNLSVQSGTSNADRAFSDQVIGYWTRFAATGAPGAGAATWPQRTAELDAYLAIGDPIQAATGLHAATCSVLSTWGTP